ncbi:MAG: MBL fold metallo-hydrolase [Nitrospirae bacterium]|nr:MBL fold metallo-hydrolase [Nitrospirota bacterium]
MNLNVIIHRGTSEIGGSCVEVCHGDTRVVIDIGMPLVKPDGGRFDMKAHVKKSGPELVKDGILPNIPGCYPWDDQNRPIDGLLLSHAHFDHYGFASFLRRDITTYLGEGTKRLIEISALFIGHNCNTDYCRIFESYKPFQIGTITVTPYLMDHSAFDAYAFLIEAGGKKIIYTGDFREHGRKPERFKHFLKAAPKNVDALLMEGTLIGREGIQKTELEIESEFRELFKKTPSIVMVAASGQNIDRLVSIYKGTKAAKRVLVMDVYVAHVLKSLSDLAGLPYPSAYFKDIRVFFPQSICRKLSSQGEEEIFKQFGKYKISREEICSRGDEVVMLIRTSMIRDYLKLMMNIEGAPVVWSQWEGYLKYDSSKPFKNFMEEKKMKLVNIHTSGHAPIETMRKMVTSLQPKQIVPIHTMFPERYSEHFSDFPVTDLKDGAVLEL